MIFENFYPKQAGTRARTAPAVRRRGVAGLVLPAVLPRPRATELPADWAQGQGEAPPLRFWDLGPVTDSAAGLAALNSGAAALYQPLFGPLDGELATQRGSATRPRPCEPHSARGARAVIRYAPIRAIGRPMC